VCASHLILLWILWLDHNNKCLSFSSCSTTLYCSKYNTGKFLYYLLNYKIKFSDWIVCTILLVETRLFLSCGVEGFCLEDMLKHVVKTGVLKNNPSPQKFPTKNQSFLQSWMLFLNSLQTFQKEKKNLVSLKTCIVDKLLKTVII